MPVRFLLSTPLFVGLLYATLSCATAAEKPQAPAFKHEPGTTKGVVDLDNFTQSYAQPPHWPPKAGNAKGH